MINAIFISEIGVVRRRINESDTEINAIMTKLYRYGFYGALIISLGLSLTSHTLIHMLYGEQYLPAVRFFKLLIFSLPWVTIGSIQLLTIYTGRDPQIHLKKTMTMAFISPGLAVLCWTLAGEIGLGISVVISQSIGCFFLNYIFDRQALVSQSNAIFFIGGKNRVV